jgi:hypothetical protein
MTEGPKSSALAVPPLADHRWRYPPIGYTARHPFAVLSAASPVEASWTRRLTSSAGGGERMLTRRAAWSGYRAMHSPALFVTRDQQIRRSRPSTVDELSPNLSPKPRCHQAPRTPQATTRPTRPATDVPHDSGPHSGSGGVEGYRNHRHRSWTRLRQSTWPEIEKHRDYIADMLKIGGHPGHDPSAVA